ncbi:hypothetical protein Y5W_00870 [Alcanivorax sp. 521-1]|uniref:Preprotein translocase subunit YajC n=1 Tax=Alloalcanivorax profundimaris TaxID=2735259 RepID=A0ABS0AN77_9GAMM|nr:PP0621 family protein [Alloalcanivorax profundimaris]MAO60873.1 hypothetical protein [Alcanivorax sp.]QJX02215.1 hypothetical protein HML84_09500 [Alcanivorax sp. IO_7]UWN49193.1 hypothetical protein ASALC70_01392 [Alcanivorax sp. ALC70]MAY11977.1 hypothetical protein [Alcanivorax sp.]MBF5055576.1 hypothetical protein [Alloalcanivorax profundimaris]|tara:strand:+ start:271 stop:528 length:258 start_codon:yes stop_codon:yes gene_type:complete
MGLIRLLILAALVYLVWRFAKRLLAAANNDDGGTRPTRSAEPRGETMIRCQQCGLHVPEREAFRHRGLGFCSQEHQRQYLEHHEP